MTKKSLVRFTKFNSFFRKFSNMAFQDGGSIGYGSDDSLQDLADR